MIRLAAIGLGNRTRKYLEYVQAHPEEVSLVAVVEPDDIRRKAVAAGFGLSEAVCFRDAKDLFAAPLQVDGVIIASPDDLHFDQTMQAISHGWHVLLEKPVAESIERCRQISEAARRAKVQVLICYVLRYHPYYRKLRELVRGGAIGEVVSASHRVNIGTDRMTHTYVRGPWGIAADSSPSFLSKCCHDVDILLWITGKHARKVSSFGSLKVFRPENAPAGAADRCVDCPVERSCPYSAVDLYQRRQDWVGNFVVPEGRTLDQVIAEELQSGRFGRCAYRCGSDVADHQTVSFQTEDGSTFDIQMNAFTRKDNRDTIFSGTEGEIHADEQTIVLRRFAEGTKEVFDFRDVFELPLHGYADLSVVEDFVHSIAEGRPCASPVEEAVESHQICYLAEQSRNEEKVFLI